MANREKDIPKSGKDNISILEMIRRRTGLLVGLVGLALFIFILESLLGSGRSIFGNDDMTTVGSINGKKVDRNDFLNRVEYKMNSYKQNGRENPDDQVRGQVIDNVWQQYVLEYAVKPQFEKAGINVSEDEIYQLVVVNPAESVIQQLTDPNTKRINEQFSRPDGSLDLIKWRQAVQNVTGESELAVKQMEDNVRTTRMFEKFRALVNKGLFVTTPEAELVLDNDSRIVNVSFVFKRLDQVEDTLAKVSREEVQKYYQNHTYQYVNKEAIRKMEFVAFNISPSDKDLEMIEKDAKRVADEWKGKNLNEDSVLMSQESEAGNIDIMHSTRISMPVRDTNIYHSAIGSIFGPFNEGANFNVYKLLEINKVADSARVRHILIGLNDPQSNQAKRTKKRAKTEADSLLTLIKEKRVSFDSLVRNVSDDAGSKLKGGDYGWYNEEKQFVDPFKYAGLMGTKGNISVVETQFGYHIIEVLDVSETKHDSYKIARIAKAIHPSEETQQKIYTDANRFAGEYNTAELFDKGVEVQKLSKRLADNIKQSDRSIMGMTGARELVRWIFQAKKGDVGIFSLQSKYIIAKVTGAKSVGILPLDEVYDEASDKAKREKKANIIAEEFNSHFKANSIEDLAKDLGLTAKRQDRLMLSGNMVDELGIEPAFTGVASALKIGRSSKVIIGESSVYKLRVNGDEKAKDRIKSIAEIKKQEEQNLTSRSDYESFNALKETADIDDRKGTVD